MPSRSSTSVRGSGRYSSGSMPLWMTVTRSRVDRRVDARMSRAHARGDGDHGVGGLDAGPLAKRREGVAAAELLGFPGSQRLEAVGGHDVGDAVQQLGQVPAEVGVPGVAVDDVGAARRRPPCADRPTCARGRRQRPVGRRARPRAGSWPPPAPRRRPRRRPEAVDAHVDQPGQLPAEVLDVDAGAAVDLGRELPGEQRDPRGSRHPTRLALADDDDPALGDVNARGRRPGRRRCRRRAATATFLSMMARRTTAPRPTTTSSMRTESSTRAPESTRTPGESTDRRTVPPEMITPALTIESSAGRSARAPRRRTWPAGSWLVQRVDRPVAVVEVEDRMDRDQVHVAS